MLLGYTEYSEDNGPPAPAPMSKFVIVMTAFFSEPKTYLLHDTSLALGKGNVATRLVADELDFDFAALAAALVIIIIIVIGRGRAGALDTAGFVVDIAIAHGMRVVKLGGRGLFVLIGDVGHFGM